METRVVFLDIDGTLTYGETVPQRNIDVIRKCRELGHKVLLNTGRSAGFIPRFIFEQVELDGFVAGIGSHVVCNGITLKRVRFPFDELCDILHRYRNSGREVIFEGEVESVGYNIGCRPGVSEVKTADEFEKRCSQTPLTKVFISGVLDEAEQERLSASYNFFQHDEYAEFSCIGCSKSSGMEAVLGYLGLTAKSSIAIGDSVNDVDMLAYAGVSVAMGNSEPGIKELCDRVTCDAKDGGVGAALEELLLRA